MPTPETAFDLSQCAAGLADAAALMAEAAQHLSEAARAMCYMSPLGSNILLDVANHKNAGFPGYSGESDGLSNHQSDTEDANTGKNVHRPESLAETLELHDCLPTKGSQPALHDQSLTSPAFGAPTLTDQDKLRDAVLFPGRYFIILEEEFDTLPLIAAYASICRKVLCCMPFIEASQSWRVLLSAMLPNHDVLEVTEESSAFSPGVAQYLSSDMPSLLIQSFTSWQTHRTVSSISDSFLIWGFLNVGEDQLTRIQDTVMNAHHTCAIVTPQEYKISHIKAYFASLGFTEYPKSASIKQFNVTSLLSGSRTTVQSILYDPDLYDNIRHLYRASLGFYNDTPSKSIWRSTTWTSQLANAFAAKILLHGRVEDGCSRFKPDGMMLPVDRETIRKLGLERAVQLGLIMGDPAGLDNYPAAPSRSTVQRENTLTLEPVGKWYMVLEEDFDATPFILYQMEQHLKVICFISYGSTAQPYQNVFSLLSPIQYSVLRPGHSTDSTNKGISMFNSLQSGLLLLRGAKTLSALGSLHLTADVVIYWGVPPEPHLTTYMNTVYAAQTYILMSSIDDLASRQRVMSGNIIKEYPESMQMNSVGPKSPLQPYRERTRQAMGMVSAKLPRRIYSDQVKTWVQTRRFQIRECIIRANQFAARVLLHGEAYDGSALYPPINARPVITQKQVIKCGLQPFVDEGLMWME